ncbi:ATP-grasp domain-containing protein [Pseudonocardia sp. N23]|uniref:carboxylate--amine ligase n=1 Tax=Pseudonocardia sp. N23 TaxID=1987376 RepID=UPI000BFDDF95|nr:ATP-grasp domain-containing protein [Pseudonocardia sp. N23]GAY10935.1 ATP-grasp enzyme-like protein [Pseudonocardia sp. N23]
MAHSRPPHDGDRVLLTGAEYTGGLAALRGLHRAGYRTWVATTDPHSYGALSRAAAGVVPILDPRVDPEGFVHGLAAAAARTGATVVLPGTEAGLLALADRRNLFPAGVAVGAPDAVLVADACDKSLLDTHARAAGFEVPPTTHVTLSDLDDGAAVTFPAVVKPLRSEMIRNGRLERIEVARVTGLDALVAALHDLPGQAGLVQPYMYGRIRTVNGLAWEGQVVTTVHKRADRTWPRDCGVVSFATTVARDPALDEAAKTLMANLRWSGLFNIQLIESASGPLLIDLNPRVYHSLALAITAGPNLPAMWADLLLGRTPRVVEYEVGRTFRAEDDVYAVLSAARSRGARSALSGLRPRHGTTHAVLDRHDPRPTRALVGRVVSGLRRKVADRLHR